MTAPLVPDNNKARVSRNVDKMSAQGASSAEIERYIQSEGLSASTTPPAGIDSNVNNINNVGNAEGLAMSALQGATLGGSDELLAGATAFGPGGLARALSQGQNPITVYKTVVDALRERQRAYQTKNPVKSGLAEAAGGVVPAVLAPAGGLIRTGAAFGAGSALGHGEGPVGEQIKGVATGGALGAALGGGVGLLARAGKNLAGSALTRLNLRPKETKFGITGTTDLARNFLRDQFNRDAITNKTPLNLTGHPDEIVADIGGTMVKRSLGGIQSLPGRAANVIRTGLEKRTKEQFPRITSELQNILHVPVEDADRITKDLILNKAATAKPLYDKAYAHGAVDDREINNLLNNRWFKRAWIRARGVASDENKPLPQLYKKITKADESGKQVTSLELLTEAPDVRTLDYIQRELRGIVETGYNGKGLSSTQAKAIKDLRSQLVKRLDELVPDYQAARANFASYSSAQKALDDGLDIFRQRARLTTDEVNALSDADREMYLVGAFRAIRDRLSRVNDKRDISNVLNNPDVREQLAAISRSPGEFDDIMSMLQRENRMMETANTALGGSNTTRSAAMQAEIEGVSPDVVTALGSLARARPALAAVQGLRSLFTRQSTHPAGGVAESAGNLLMQPATPGALQQILQPPVVQNELTPGLLGQLTGGFAAPRLSSNVSQAREEAVNFRAGGLSNEQLYQQLSSRYTPEVVKFLIAATPQRVPQQ